MEKTNISLCAKSAAYSLIVYLCTSWLHLYGQSSVILIRYICYSALWWYVLDKYKDDKTIHNSQASIVVSMILAVLILEIPVRIAFFQASIGSIPSLMGTIGGIFLSYWYYKQRKVWVFVIALTVLAIICTIGLEKWEEVYWIYRGNEVESLK